MKFAQNNHPTLSFGPTCLFGTREYENCDATLQRVWPHFEVIEAHIAELRVKRTQDTAKKYSQDGN